MSQAIRTTDEIELAADLIQKLDSARANANSSVVNAAKDSEEARNNAKWISSLVKRLQSKSTIPDGEWEKLVLSESTEVSSADWDENAAPHSYHHHRLQHPHHDRLKQVHEEEILALSLRLEQSQHALERLQMTQDETQLALSRAQAKNAQLERQVEVLEDKLHQAPDTRKLETALENAKYRVEAAELDAQLALDLAKKNAEQREQFEGYLHDALEQMDHLQDGASKTVRFAESPTVVEVRREVPRALVLKGRCLLEQSKESSAEDGSMERRKKLRELLKLDLEPTIDHPVTPTASADPKTIKRIQESGKKLGLAGRYWTEPDVELDTLVRHYCTAIEVTVERQQKEIFELESLCSIYEKGVSDAK